MDVFRRLTKPTLKKLYRFILKRLVGRFLDDDITLEQLDVQLGAGRIELTDLSLNVSALAGLLPNLSFRLAHARIGRLRVEISYSKLPTESLAFFLDDVVLEIAPCFGKSDGARVPGKAVSDAGHGLPGGHQTNKTRRGNASSGEVNNDLPDRARVGEAGEGLDFLAQWIEQITSKVKIVVKNLAVRVTSTDALEGVSFQPYNGGSNPFLEFRFSSLQWSDETPESSSFLPERSSRLQNAAEDFVRPEGSGKVTAPTIFAHKRLTLGLVVAEWNGSSRRRTREVMKMGGTGCIVIKHDTRPLLGPALAVPVLDVDISLRQAEFAISADVCVGLHALSSTYLNSLERPAINALEDVPPVVADIPIQSLFCEEFWYLDDLPSAGESCSKELNFDTLSSLLEQYANARARLAEAECYGQEVFGMGSQLSLGQSDVFYDCVEGSVDESGERGVRRRRSGAGVDGLESAKIRVRMAGLDVTLLLDNEPREPSSSGCSGRYIRFQTRHVSQTLQYAGGVAQSVAEVGTFVVDCSDGSAHQTPRALRVLEVLVGTDGSPCIQITGSGSVRGSQAGAGHVGDGGITVDVESLPLAAVLDVHVAVFVTEFLSQVKLQAPSPHSVGVVDERDESTGNPRSDCVVSSSRHIAVTAAIPKLTVRFPADPSSCSSVAHAALVTSVEDGTSPVGWAPRRPLGDVAPPALVLEIDDIMLKIEDGPEKMLKATLECSKLICEMILISNDGELMGLYFLEACYSVTEGPLKVEYGLAENIGNRRKLDVIRSADAGLKFLHTWEPNDGVDSGLGEVPPPLSFGQEQGSVSGVPEQQRLSHQVVLCSIPCLAVELSRLELVVLTDILGGLSRPCDDMAAAEVSLGGNPQLDAAPPPALEVIVEAHGTTIVLHEAAAYAEEPGPHSFVLNFGSACLCVGGNNKFMRGSPAPLVTVSSGDACIYETLRGPCEDPFDASDRKRVNGPLLFLPGNNVPTYPSVEDLPKLGFVPVLYQTKWVKGTSPITAELALAVSKPEAVCKTITATLNLYDVSLRHTVASSWLPRLLGIVVGDVPAGKAASSSCQAGVGGVNANGTEESGGNLTKVFITVFNGVVDYMPQARGARSVHAASQKPGAAVGTMIGALAPTEGRAVFPIGVLRVSSNMVAGAPMQGFKVVIRDIGVYMSNRIMDYCSEDNGLCRGALDAQRRRGPPLLKPGFSSVQEFLETSHFVQIATLNFLDAFLRIRSQVLSPRDAFTAVELWMGVLHVYTCQDSLSTCQALLGEWWALVNECRTAAADLEKSDLSKCQRPAGQASQVEAQHIGKSLLDDVEQDAFLPGSSREHPPVVEAKTDPDGVISNDGTHHPGFQPRKEQSLVIEDYYCVSVEPADTPVAPASLAVNTLEEDFSKIIGVDDSPLPGQGSSFISEGEGPAQWLAPPKSGLDYCENLSMESAEETSESGGEEEKIVDAGAVSLAALTQSVTRRSNFGFSLPAPIEIELEDRQDSGSLDAKESGELSSTRHAETPTSSFEEMESISEREIQQVGNFSPRICFTDLGYRTQNASFASRGEQVDLDAPSETKVLSQRDSFPFEERSGVRGQARCMSAAGSPEAGLSKQSADFNLSTKIEPVREEQEARWLETKRKVSNKSTEVRDAKTSSSPSQPAGFRVYPHYVPIPTTAEATSTPFLSGDPLVALGHEHEKNAGTGDEQERYGRKDPVLQFQLAIHDLSICWRLFEGRDWVKNANDDDLVYLAKGERRRHSRTAARGSVISDAAGGKHLRSEGECENSSTSSTAAGVKPRKAELLDALLENYQDERGGYGEVQTGRRAPRQPKVKLLNLPRDDRSGKRTGRDTSCMLEVVLEHSSLRLDNFHPGPPASLLSNLLFSIKDLYASDTLTSNRPRKTLQHWRDDIRHPREFQQKMVTIRMTVRSPSDHFCPEDAPLGDEIMLKVRLLPVHLSFGQHTVDFLRSFSRQPQLVPTVHIKRASGGDDVDLDNGASPFFVSSCDVGAFKVKIDYQPRTIKVGALQHGDYMELLNLFPLEGVHLVIQKLLLTGVSGWNGVTQLLLQSWVQDITSNQLHKFLAGTTAVRPLVTVGKGVADLVLLPVEQYRRDGRVLRGLRKGTQSFLRAITIETLHTSHRVASFVARTLDDIVTQPGSGASLRGLEYYDEQPTGVLDSLEYAYDALAKEVQVAAHTIIAIPYEEEEEVIGPHGRSYVRSVARALPVAVLRPIVGASEALSCTLLGFRNYMSPVIRREEEGRWR